MDRVCLCLERGGKKGFVWCAEGVLVVEPVEDIGVLVGDFVCFCILGGIGIAGDGEG